MLSSASVSTILPVVDPVRARDFYEKKLGLEPRGVAGDGSFLFRCGRDATLALLPKPEGTRADHTAISFEVQDLPAELAELERRGVVFEDYDLPTLKTVNHISVLGNDRAAWFRDTEGNILCLHDHQGAGHQGGGGRGGAAPR